MHYFQSIHNSDIFEVRGVQTENIENRIVSQNSVKQTTNLNLSCAVALYSLCYYVMKPCNYWNYNSSLPTIVNNSKKECYKSSLEHNQLSPANLPRTVDVCGTEVNLDNLFESEGLLTDSPQSKSILEDDILYNSECTGFLISFFLYCISCIFKCTKRLKYIYSLLLYNEGDTYPIQYTKNINGMASLVDAIRKIQEKYNSQGHYRIQLSTRLCKVLVRNKRKKLMNNHRQKQDSKTMEPPKKNIILEKKQVMDMKNKQEIQKIHSTPLTITCASPNYLIMILLKTVNHIPDNHTYRHQM